MSSSSRVLRRCFVGGKALQATQRTRFTTFPLSKRIEVVHRYRLLQSFFTNKQKAKCQTLSLLRYFTIVWVSLCWACYVRWTVSCKILITFEASISGSLDSCFHFVSLACGLHLHPFPLPATLQPLPTPSRPHYTMAIRCELLR